MGYTFMPSLEHMSLVAIIVSLWSEIDVVNSIYRYYSNSEYSIVSRFACSDETWQRIENKVCAKISFLQLPDVLKLNLRNCVRPIGLQFLKFLDVCSEMRIKVERYLISNLCWTSIGTVDTKNTAICLIKNEDLDICKRYELACVFCLKKDIPELWKKIPTVRSKAYYSKYVRVFIPNKLALLWAYDMKGELARLAGPIAVNWLPGRHNTSPYQFALEYSAFGGNRAGVEFFLSKMTPNERNESLVRVSERAVFLHKSEVFCFLLSKMDDEQLMQVYRSFPQFALRLLLEWPFQNLFMQMASNVWNFLSQDSLDYLLNKIIEKIREGYKDYDYQKLFESAWLKSPAAHKQWVMDKCVYGNLLRDLSEIKDMESITALILQYAIIEVRDRRIFVLQKWKPRYSSGYRYDVIL